MSEKKHHERNIADSNGFEKILGFIKNNPSGAHLYELIDDKLIFKGGNASADKILGIDHNKLEGLAIEEAFPNLTDTDIPSIYKDIAIKGNTWESAEIPYQDDRISGYFKVNAFQTDQGKMIAMFTDISNFKNIEFALKLKNEQLQAAEEELKENNQKLVQLNELLRNQNDELKNTLELLHENEDKFKAAFNTIPDIVAISRLSDGKFYEVNDSFTRLTGYTWKEAKNKTSVDLNLWINNEVRDRVWEILRAKKAVSNIESMYRKKDGQIRHGLMSTSIFTLQNDDFVITVIRDIEEIIKARESLRNSEERFTQFAENIDDVFWITEDEKLLYINKAAKTKFGISRKDIQRNPASVIEFIHPDDRLIYKKLVNIQTLRSGKNTSGQLRIIMKGNKTYWLWVRLFPVLNDKNELYRIVGIASDITLQKNTENELRSATQKAMESDQLKSAFLANLSHEIRTPMNGIVGFSGLLLNQNIKPELRKQYIEVINNCSTQLLNIIEDMVDISKIEANQMSVSFDDCNINELINDLHVFFSQQLKTEQKSSIALHSHKNLPDNRCTVITDPSRLRQILMNMLNNAVKFTHAGEINFGYKIKENNIEFFVSDTGIGIEDNLRDEIFKPFRQADIHASREYGGAGLGLSISRGLVNLLGGNTWFTSQPGKGSEFFFTIPYKMSISKKPAPEIQEATKDIWTDYTVLIVEDDEVNYMFLSEILEEKGLKIIRALTGIDAIEIARSQSPDIIIMDIRLPVMNGLDATRNIRSSGNNVPILAQTAFAMAEDKQLCLDAGCNDYIAKPIQKEVLIKKVGNCLNIT